MGSRLIISVTLIEGDLIINNLFLVILTFTSTFTEPAGMILICAPPTNLIMEVPLLLKSMLALGLVFTAASIPKSVLIYYLF